MIQLGAYIQLNGDSIVGKNGLRMKLFAQKLMKKELVHFVASDMHHMESRRPNLKECAEYMEKHMDGCVQRTAVWTSTEID